MVFDSLAEGEHEQVSYFSDPETGLEAIIAVHDTTLGPGLGGTRMLDYETEADALDDVLRLSKAMTKKAAAADLDLGGAKAVIVGDHESLKTTELLEAYGRAVDCMGGRYITSVDVNSSVADMEVIATETDHVVGREDGLGDPSPITATGVLSGLEAAVEYEYGTDSFEGIDVVVQGLGKVGSALASGLIERGASVTVSDVSEDNIERFLADHDAELVAPDDIYDEPCDVFAPCAIGGVINDETVPRLDCDIVAGGANNPLAERRHADELADRGIWYAPDYVINAGGLITVAEEYRGGTRDAAFEKATAIGDRLSRMMERAEDEGTTVLDAADAFARERIENADRTTPARFD
ncbi:glutamate dehydrogenase/leucine dehydrogenase [Halovivax ruber XH-70]|uniref:Glutamate dehydrogenase/leucine dehydrogenase n=1 Tax=Halovivax ruber (strain DSM 18193 / JCM 13892 / XH-70) TaxID=797302 RepID=L0IGV0_HALRX|nr:Glu/Leu/Phe/Val dehydrogenase family protein [Halovivax ruber]AGB17207.1 glutamate dehydrogenase/leucine dehydrogenase [Halovivax ruber XH-70]